MSKNNQHQHRDEGLRAWLEARRDELERRIGRMEMDVRHQENGLDDDAAERAVETQNDDVLASLEDNALRELGAIRQALARMKQGGYGICRICGESISTLRLRSLPTAERCIFCAERESMNEKGDAP